MHLAVYLSMLGGASSCLKRSCKSLTHLPLSAWVHISSPLVKWIQSRKGPSGRRFMQGIPRCQGHANIALPSLLTG